MDQTNRLLQCVVENARTGMNAVDQLLQKVEDAGIRDELMREREQYQAIAHTAEQTIYTMGGKPETVGVMQRVCMWMGMELNTLKDRTPAHIADMVIQGATMGVVDMTKARNELSEADAQAQGIAGEFIVQQQDNIERMKAFLR